MIRLPDLTPYTAVIRIAAIVVAVIILFLGGMYAEHRRAVLPLRDKLAVQNARADTNAEGYRRLSELVKKQNAAVDAQGAALKAAQARLAASRPAIERIKKDAATKSSLIDSVVADMEAKRLNECEAVFKLIDGAGND